MQVFLKHFENILVDQNAEQTTRTHKRIINQIKDKKQNINLKILHTVTDTH